jgi:protein-tyrosine phosphatase
MMFTELHWADGPWPGKLAMSARPRGGEWLEDEAAHWRCSGIDTVLSLLEAHEELDLDLAGEAAAARAEGMNFISFLIVDRQTPESEAPFVKMLEIVEAELNAGRNVLLHCRQGVGRAGLVAACLFLAKGYSPESAIEHLSRARGLPIPETASQRRWIEQHATSLAPTR